MEKKSEYLSEMAQHRFVINPHGNCLDCHRIWEALLVGTIPIVKKSSLDPLYENLPVLIINDWSEVTPELLNNTFQECVLNWQHFKWEKLYLSYWTDRLRKVQQMYLHSTNTVHAH